MKLAFVIPWYGPKIPGGAERLCRAWVEHLVGDGWDVEVLTTTIKEFQSNWNHPFHRPGSYRENGVPVRRFRLRPGDHAVFNAINLKLLSGEWITAEEELRFLSEGPNSDDLQGFIRDHRSEYTFFFLPYLFGTTYYGVSSAQDRAVLIPCLHDESYAHLQRIRQMFHSARAVMFNSEPEQRLACRLYGTDGKPSVVLGMGLDYAEGPKGDGLREEFKRHQPYVLYVGRRDRTKNTDLLIEYFVRFKRRNPDSPLKLMLAGAGEIPVPAGFSSAGLVDGIRDLGFLSEQTKRGAYAAATVLCNPSTNESFSIVMMEAWLCGTPALVHADCLVTRHYVEESKGGLYFSDFYEFEACLQFLSSHAEIRERMGNLGAAFVKSRFSWPVLLGRFREWMGECFGNGETA
jgi:glycosyltransferase involved in cell wall biosynthesis